MIRLSIFLFIALIIIISLIILEDVFVLASPPSVVNVFPENKNNSVSQDASIIINFDKPLKRQELKPSIFPEAYGEWKFQDPITRNHLFKTLVFEPALAFENDTQYEVKIENIKGFGLNKTNSFSFTFQTKPAQHPDPTEELKKKPDIADKKPEKQKSDITLLDIPVDWQDYSLSCEAASLKMALGYKGVYISENEIMHEVGYDTTPHKGDVWGDPYKAYVGNIAGQMCKTGYGVYWDPVAKAANNWKTAEAFSNWTLRDLIREIQLGNPVVVWGTLPVSSLSDCSWYTKDGKYIKAYKETHVRLAVGFIGSPENPSQIILNDPLSGRIYWSADYFLTNWESFGYSGVAVR